MAETLNLALPPELAAQLRAAAVSGGYADVSELVSEAIWEWHIRRMGGADSAELKRLVQEGAESGPGLEVAEVVARLSERFGSIKV